MHCDSLRIWEARIWSQKLSLHKDMCISVKWNMIWKTLVSWLFKNMWKVNSCILFLKAASYSLKERTEWNQDRSTSTFWPISMSREELHAVIWEQPRITQAIPFWMWHVSTWVKSCKVRKEDFLKGFHPLDVERRKPRGVAEIPDPQEQRWQRNHWCHSFEGAAPIWMENFQIFFSNVST